MASPRVAVGHPGRSAAVQEESGKGGPGVPEPDLVWKRHRIVSLRRRRPRKALSGAGWEGRRARQAPRPGPSAPAWASAGIGVAHAEAFPEGHTEAPPARFVNRGVRPGSHSGQRYVTAEAGTPPRPAKTTAGAALAQAWRPAWEEGVPGGTRQEGAPWAPPRCTGHRGVRLRPRPCSERRPPRRAAEPGPRERAAVFADPSRGPQHGRAGAAATVRGARASCGAGAATAQGPRGRAAASSRARGAAQAPVLSDSRAGAAAGQRHPRPGCDTGRPRSASRLRGLAPHGSPAPRPLGTPGRDAAAAERGPGDARQRPHPHGRRGAPPRDRCAGCAHPEPEPPPKEGDRVCPGGQSCDVTALCAGPSRLRHDDGQHGRHCHFSGPTTARQGGGALLCLALSQRLSHEQHPFCKNSRRFTHQREVPGSRSRARAGGAAGRLVPLPEDQSH